VASTNSDAVIIDTLLHTCLEPIHEKNCRNDESVLQKATKLIEGMFDKSYEERLELLVLIRNMNSKRYH